MNYESGKRGARTRFVAVSAKQFTPEVERWKRFPTHPPNIHRIYAIINNTSGTTCLGTSPNKRVQSRDLLPLSDLTDN